MNARVVTLSILITLTSLGVRGAGPAASAPTTPCVSVLFVGDSLTYVNNMPELVARIGQSKGRCIVTSMVASGGESLRDHWQSGDVERALLERRWQYVVIQDQSTFGEAYLVNGDYRVHDASDLFTYGHLIMALVRKHGGTPVVYLPWAARFQQPRDTLYVRWAYVTFARGEHATIVPAMDAWARARRQLPAVNFFRPDGLHPTAAGAYLTAALFYAKIGRASPLGATTTIVGPSVDFETGTLGKNARVQLVDMPEELGEHLQRIALEVADQPAAMQPAKPGPIVLPTVPIGQAFRVGALEGQWKGPIHLYPRSGILTLYVCAQPRMTVRATIDLTAGTQSHSFVDSRPTITASSLAFTDHHGPSGGRIKYTAALTSKGLAGVGEILVPNAPIYGIGTWSAARQSKGCGTSGDVHDP